MKRIAVVNRPTKLLYISWTILPVPGGSAFITHQLARQLNAERLLVAGGSNRPVNKTRITDGVPYHYFFTEISFNGHGQRFFGLFRWLLFPLLVFNLVALVRKQKITEVLATFPDGYYLLAAWLTAKICKLDLYSYFHNTFVENRRGLNRWWAQKIQSIVFRDSKIIFTVSEGMDAFYKRMYPGIISKLEILQHISYETEVNEAVAGPLTGKKPIHLVMIGTFNHSNMEATRRLLKLLSGLRGDYHLDIYTPTGKNVFKYKWDLDLDALGVHYLGLLPEDEFRNTIRNYDACLLTHGFYGAYSQIEYETIFPTRMIPFLLSGKPILVHAPENSFLVKFIRKYDCAELVTATNDLIIIDALQRITSDRDRIRQLHQNAAIAAQYFYGPEVIKSLLRHLPGLS